MFNLKIFKNKIEKLDNDVFKNACLVYAENLNSNNMPVVFDIKHLSMYLGISVYELKSYIYSPQYQYREWEIPKKNGKTRLLCCPSLHLKEVQRWILDEILYKIAVSDYATGFKPNSSIFDNASKHTGKEVVVNLDIKDFFPSINFNRVFRIFYYYGYSKKISFALASLCTYNDQLPQGAPTSPYLSNIVTKRLDKRIGKLIQLYDGSYTRYADDITISGKNKIINCIKYIKIIINDENFMLNNSKYRVARKHQTQNVTGLNVNNNTVSIPKMFRKNVKQEIHYCRKYGHKRHLEYIESNKAFYKEHLLGKIMYINMINKSEGQKLMMRFNQIDWDY